MISVEEAKKILEGIPVHPVIEEVSVDLALRRVLGRDIVSGINMPPFNKSAMDGYALQSGDASDRFEIIRVIPAGVVPGKKIQKGQCARIMTGGMVPEGADRVVKREVTVEEEGFMRIVAEDRNLNICYRGEDIKTGDVVLKKGVIIRPPEIAVIASMGLAGVAVYRRPAVSIIATGSELVEPGRPLAGGQIYDSNSSSLAAQVMQAGALVKRHGAAVDSPEKIQEAIEQAMHDSDIVLISGGVSAGDFDYVPDVLKDLGFTLLFEKVSIKPGMPTVFGALENHYIFGVPGNPVSSFIIFEVFIRPFLLGMMGRPYIPEIIPGIMKDAFTRKKADRTAYIPVHYMNGSVRRLAYHGSAHIHALSRANGLLCVPEGVETIPAGSKVDVRLL